MPSDIAGSSAAGAAPVGADASTCGADGVCAKAVPKATTSRSAAVWAQPDNHGLGLVGPGASIIEINKRDPILGEFEAGERTILVRGSIALKPESNHGAYPEGANPKLLKKAVNMPITKSSRALVDEAMGAVRTYSPTEVMARLDDARVQLVDIRDVRELADGTAVGAFHAPRGMLEVWVDPDSPYFKPIFGDEGKEYILFCGAGWRSALTAKTLQDMGMTNVAHIDGGYAEWVKQGGPTETLEAQKARRAVKR